MLTKISLSTNSHKSKREDWIAEDIKGLKGKNHLHSFKPWILLFQVTIIAIMLLNIPCCLLISLSQLICHVHAGNTVSVWILTN